MKKQKVEVIRGYGRLKGRGQVEVLTDSGTKTLEAKNIILTTAPRRGSWGLTADEKTIVTNIEILSRALGAQEPAGHRRRRRWRRVRLHLKRFGSQVTIFEMLPRLVPVEDEDVE
ncbi:MAG: hypothetical protein QM757_15990 [Paludibaculum sp.]